jgi:hypothetical protein
MATVLDEKNPHAEKRSRYLWKTQVGDRPVAGTFKADLPSCCLKRSHQLALVQHTQGWLMLRSAAGAFANAGGRQARHLHWLVLLLALWVRLGLHNSQSCSSNCIESLKSVRHKGGKMQATPSICCGLIEQICASCSGACYTIRLSAVGFGCAGRLLASVHCLLGCCCCVLSFAGHYSDHSRSRQQQQGGPLACCLCPLMCCCCVLCRASGSTQTTATAGSSSKGKATGMRTCP